MDLFVSLCLLTFNGNMRCLCAIYSISLFVLISGVVLHDAAEVEEPLEEKFNTTAERSPGLAWPVNPTTANGHAAKRKRADTPGKYKTHFY